MKIKTLLTGFFKLDGGAMFGIVPKQLWSRLITPDENNMCTWALRCLLIQVGDRNIIVDTGIGDKQDEKFRSHFEPHESIDLADALATHQLKPEDITDVFLTHLHFDHSGGAVKKDVDGNLIPSFPKATYHVDQRHWNWALNPNFKEKGSFLKENFVPLQEANQLSFLDAGDGSNWSEWIPGIDVRACFGHTEAMMILRIKYEGRTFIYAADLMPSAAHVGEAYVMSYDVQPLISLREKEWLVKEAYENDYIILFEHDASYEAGKVGKNEKGRLRWSEKYKSIAEIV